MTTTLTSKLSVKSRGLLQEAITGIGTPKLEYLIELVESLADGTGASQANKVGAQPYDIAAGGTLVLDLSNFVSTLTGHSKTIRFTNIKGFLLINKSAASGEDLVVGANGADPWSAPFNGEASSIVELPADSVLMMTNKISGWTVTNGSSDLLLISNPNSNPVSIEVCFVGVGT